MAEILNLRLERKRKQREKDQVAAASNRAVHGRTKAEKQSVQAEHEAKDRFLDGHRRIKSDEE
ncbi:MAG: DUF4169 family protein [Rhizobiaceae bacterium]|nr:DUF4169 family protein [Rhizobiaceae bacterium]